MSSTTTPKKLLEDLGLTSNEQKIYIGFLENPDITPAELGRIISLDKSSTYRATKNLEKMGLAISSPQKKGTTYRSSDPDMLISLHNQKIQSLHAHTDTLSAYVESLKKETYTRPIDIQVTYGIEAIQNIMTESLSCTQKLIRERFRHHSFFEDEDHVAFVEEYARKRVARNIHIHQLEYDLQFLTATFKDIMTDQKKYLKEVRMLPKDIDDMNSLRIWDETTNIVSEDEKKEIIVITINDELITALMRNMYDFVWNRSERFLSEQE